MSRSADVRQRDVGDGGVEHHHQLGHGDEHERPTEVALVEPVEEAGAMVEAEVMVCRPVGGRGLGSSRGGQDDLVDHACHGLLVGGLPEHEAAVQDDPGQGRGEQVEIEVGGDLAAGTGPLEDPAGDVDLGLDHAGAELLGELRVVVQRGDHRGHQLRRAGVGEPAVAAGHLHEVVAEVAGVDVGDLQRLLGAQDRVDHERGLGRPAPVERGLAGLGLGGHGVHRQLVVADAAEQVDRCVEDLLLAAALHAGAGWTHGALPLTG